MIKALIAAVAIAAIPAAAQSTEIGLTCADAKAIRVAAASQMQFQAKAILENSHSIRIDEFVIRKTVVMALNDLLKQVAAFENKNCPQA